MQQYVIIFPKVANSSPGGEILLVMKDRPTWQKGHLNLVGGKIEDGETPEQAALRELKEEAGLLPLEVTKSVLEGKKKVTVSVPLEPTVMGRIVGSWGIVHCVKVPVLFGQEITQAEGETEEVSWYSWSSVKTDDRLLPNLKVVVPLMMLGVEGWTISDEGPLDVQGSYEGNFMVKV